MLVFNVGKLIFGSEVTSAHSMLVQILYNFGALGFLVYAMIFWQLIVANFKLDHNRNNMCNAIFVMLFVGSLTDSVFFTIQIAWLNAVLVALVIRGFAQTRY